MTDSLFQSPPDDIQPDLIWYSREIEPGQVVQSGGYTIITGRGWQGRAVANPDAHAEPCRVYWGSHGCARPHGHEGAHWCDCCDCESHPDPDSGCVAGPPYYGPDTNFFGEDVPDA